MATVHIIGAGISGLSAATMLAEKRIPVKLYEATAHAGGRCRSSSHAEIGLYDHGLHLTTDRDSELQRYLARIESEAMPRRVAALPLPAAPLLDYLPWLRWALRPRGVAEHAITRESMLRDAWFRPLARLFYATPPAQLPARALRRYARRRRPYTMNADLQSSYIQPALDFLDACGGSVYFSHALTRIERMDGVPSALVFARKKILLAPGDMVILATPPAFAHTVLPELQVPVQDQSAITLHFACAHREPIGSVTYPLEAPMDLLRYDEGSIAASIRLAGPAWRSDPELLTHRVWRAIQKQHRYLKNTAMPTVAQWREKRAGHAVSESSHVPHDHGTLLLAGDWLHPALPPTLEAAAASGHAAAALAMERLPKRSLQKQR